MRTSAETLNWSMHATESDYLNAECVHTFPSVTCPASQLSKREEIETATVKGHSVIVAIFVVVIVVVVVVGFW